MARKFKDSIGMLMSDNHRLMVPVVQRAFEAEGLKINCPQFSLMARLSDSGDSILNDMALSVVKDKSTVLRHLDQLEQLDYVRRIADSQDRRRKKLVLTETGKKALALAAKVEKAIYDELLEEVSPAQRDSFYDTMMTMRQRITDGLFDGR